MAAEQSLDIGAVAVIHRFQGRDRLASSDDGEALATVFHGVEKVGEAPCRFRRCDLGHLNQIIRLWELRAIVRCRQLVVWGASAWPDTGQPTARRRQRPGSA